MKKYLCSERSIWNHSMILSHTNAQQLSQSGFTCVVSNWKCWASLICWPFFTFSNAHVITNNVHVCAEHYEKPVSCSGHFLLDRSHREQPSMRATPMINSLFYRGRRGHFNQGTFTSKTPQFSSRIYTRHPLPNQKLSVSFSLREPWEVHLLSGKTNKQHNTTEPPHGEALKWIICL